MNGSLESCMQDPGRIERLANRPLAGGTEVGQLGRPDSGGFCRRRRGGPRGKARGNRALPDGGLGWGLGWPKGGSPRSSCSGSGG